MKKKKDFEGSARRFQALSDPTRLRIIDYLLRKKTCTCCCVLQELVQKDKSVVSRHVKILADARLVTTKKQGKNLHCCIAAADDLKKVLQVI